MLLEEAIHRIDGLPDVFVPLVEIDVARTTDLHEGFGLEAAVGAASS